MKWTLLLGLLIAVPAQEADECDAKKTVPGLWCDSCSKELGKSDLNKKKACSACETKPRKALFCVKVYYQADCHPDKKDVKPIKCCKKSWKKKNEEKALVIFKCRGCSEKAPEQRKLKHAEGCKKKKVVKSCEKSGEGWHVKKKR